MRVAIVENTRVTHHGLVGVALHEACGPDRHLQTLDRAALAPRC